VSPFDNLIDVEKYSIGNNRIDHNRTNECMCLFSSALLHDIQDMYTNPTDDKRDDSIATNELLYELGPLLESVGMNDVLQRVYISAQNHSLLIPLLVLFTISQVPRMVTLKYLKSQVQNSSSSSSSNIKRDMDCSAFVIGVYTLTKQYHSDLIEDYLTCLCQCIKSHIVQAGRSAHIVRTKHMILFDVCNYLLLSSQKLVDFPLEAINMLDFLTMFVHFGDLPIKVGHH
jgi:hypothetical protein